VHQKALNRNRRRYGFKPFGCVITYLVGTEDLQIRLICASSRNQHPCLCPVRQLQGIPSYCAGSPIDQHGLTGLEMRVREQSLPGSQCGNWYGSSFQER
jgi:hypothetical protein